MKVLFDTNLYVRFFRRGDYQDLFFERRFVRYLSSIVGMEIVAGAQHIRSRKLVKKFIRTYAATGRIYSPSTELYLRAGLALSKLRKPNLSHDVLIALSAQALGATLYTTNRKDFEAIQKQVSVKMAFV